MSYLYLIASLPALRLTEPSPIPVKRFLSSCSEVIPDGEWSDLKAVFEERENDFQTPAAKRWRDQHTQLRNAVARARAAHWNCDPRQYIQPHDGFSETAERIAREAFTEKDPQRREAILDKGRWALAEDLSALEPYTFSRLFSYAVQLKIVERWAAMKPEAGKERLKTFIDAQEVSSSEMGGSIERTGEWNEQ